MNDKSSRLRFHSEHIQLDWLGFTLPSELESDGVQTLLHYLGETFQCSIQITEINHYSKVETVILYCTIETSKSPVQETYWKGVIVSFRGRHAQTFYRLIQEVPLHWAFFHEAKLNRLDLCYDRPFQAKDPDVVSFFKDSSLKSLG